MKFTKDIDNNLALFEVTRRNCAATDVGDIVEFYGFADYHDEVDYSSMMCAQIEARQHVDYPTHEGMYYPAGTAWFYDKSSVRPLTAMAKKVLKMNNEARKQLPTK